MTDDHVWFRNHVADHLLDLMDEPDTARLLAHASACADCGALLTLARAELPNGWLGADHPSAAILIRWQRDASAFDHEEARIVREHLETCVACRVDLAELAGEAVHAVPAISAPVRVVQPPGRMPVGDWTLGAIGGALATAAAILIVWPSTHSVAVDPAASLPGVETPARIPSPSPAAFLATAAPVQVLSARRGESDTTRVPLDRGTPLVPIRIPMLFVPDTTRVTVELLEASGAIVARMELSAESAQRTGLLLDTRTLGPGCRALRVSWRHDGRDDGRQYPIVFEAR